jgi:hypothetical protein
MHRGFRSLYGTQRAQEHTLRTEDGSRSKRLESYRWNILSDILKSWYLELRTIIFFLLGRYKCFLQDERHD